MSADENGIRHFQKEAKPRGKSYAPKASPSMRAQSPDTPTRSAPPKSPVEAAVAVPAVKPTEPQNAKVTFVLLEPDAKQVALCGDFNGWATDATPMKRHDGGHWETTVALAPGRYEYKFLVDGHWIPDALARENVWNYHGTLNSVVEVRP